MTTRKRTAASYSLEVRERAVRLVLDGAGEHATQWAAISSVAAKIGCTTETLRSWVGQAERDGGQRPGPTSAERERIKAWERQTRELRQANEILRKASAYCAQAELDRRSKTGSPSSTITGVSTGSSRSARCCRSPRPPPTRMSHGARIPPGHQRGVCGTRRSMPRSVACTRRASGSTALARSGGSSAARGSRLPAARWSG